ncbi:hypothetical protein [Dyadobacter sp. 3J3]|uniref:hypothetical protein n=1 Tax=Dyadobacter sp. 3J3 TaxID=2606600 RepID=UPI00135963FD|nr:hypothetical protein [Dyadobacter sp. 3J3]
MIKIKINSFVILALNGFITIDAERFRIKAGEYPIDNSLLVHLTLSFPLFFFVKKKRMAFKDIPKSETIGVNINIANGKQVWFQILFSMAFVIYLMLGYHGSPIWLFVMIGIFIYSSLEQIARSVSLELDEQTSTTFVIV